MAPTDARPFTPPAYYQDLWTLTEQCTGRTGDFARVHWYLFDAPYFADGKERTGIWHEPHQIYLSTRVAFDSADNYQIVRHEMVHDLMQKPGHGAAFVACHIPV